MSAVSTAKFEDAPKHRRFKPQDVVVRRSGITESVWLVQGRIDVETRVRAVCIFCNTDKYDLGDLGNFMDDQLEPFVGTVTIRGK